MRAWVLLAAVLCAPSPAWAVPVCEPWPAGPVEPTAEIRLGWHLFYDPILSGNRAVSCATCHHPRHGTSDGVSLGLGDGGSGLGPDRQVDADNPPEQRIPRNATGLWNLGAPGFDVMFWDGRLEAEAARPSGLRTPIGEDLGAGLSVLAAQTMFPVLSQDEMAGHYGENDVSRAVRQGMLSHNGGAWDILSARVAAVPAYRAATAAAFGEDAALDFKAIARALEAFIAWEWRADRSPFDRYLCDGERLPDAAARGMALFYGAAGCSACHSGRWQTDHGFHAIAMPQIGPGKAARFENHARDTGRMRVTGRDADAYAFRTPSLRNVTETAPYGHAGAFATLDGVVRHHLDPVASLRGYDRAQAVLPGLPGVDDFRVLDDPREIDAIAAANVLEPVALEDADIAALLAFLSSLTDQAGVAGRLGVPERVPSGLPVAR